MPTLNWIQETVWDRYWERGSSGETKIDSTYLCRICGIPFSSIDERNQHEVGHPVSNPTIFLGGKEICGDRCSVTTVIDSDGLFFRNVESMTVNGEVCLSAKELLAKISAERLAFLDIRYGNANIERQLRIDVCIADPNELEMVDSEFFQCLDVGGLNQHMVVAFVEKISQLPTVKKYGDGLVRYLQGILAKDNRSDTDSFEQFSERFNQATQSLREYDTALSHAVRSVIDFNRNDFSALKETGIPLLDSAIDFFKGGVLSTPEGEQNSKQLPVDYATENIVSSLLRIYKDGSLQDLEAEIRSFSPNYLSLQDKMKFNYICFRKCLQVGDMDAVQRYKRSLHFDDAFSETIEIGDERI